MTPLTRKLQNLLKLSAQDERMIDDSIEEVSRVSAREDLIQEGEKPKNIFLILEDSRIATRSLTRAGAKSWPT